MNCLKLGTRGSRLALWQAEYVARELKKAVPGIEIEIKVIKTSGDKMLGVALSRIGDKGLFTKEIEVMLLNREIDLAVHSMKDLPTVLEPGLMIGAVMKRENPQDVFLSSRGYKFEDLPPHAVIGTSSLRRGAQIKARRSDINIMEMRGNVDTRIKKMKAQGLDGIVLAYAGVKRLGYENLITDILPYDMLLPAAGQGAIAVEIRKSDRRTADIVKIVDDFRTRMEVTAERAFLRQLEGGCQVPVASLARVYGKQILLSGLVASLDGKTVYRSQHSGAIDEAEKVGRELAIEFLVGGAGDILEEIRRQEESR